MAKAALDAGDVFKIVVAPSWSARRLANEIDSWPKAGKKDNGEYPEGKSPTFIFNVFNIKLVMFHWFALSARYEMQSIVQCGEVHLVYTSESRIT